MKRFHWVAATDDFIVCDGSGVCHSPNDVLKEVRDQRTTIIFVVPLLQISRQVLGAYPVEGSVEPGLEVGELNLVDWKQGACVLGVILNDGLLMMKIFFRAAVTRPAVVEHVGARSKAILYEGTQVLGRGRCNHVNLSVADHEATSFHPRGLCSTVQLALHGHDY